MNPNAPTRRTQTYRLLRDSCGFTHHQTKHLIQLHLNHLGEFRNVLYRGLKKDRELWVESATLIAALSMHPDPLDAGNSILRYCWPNRSEPPEHTFTCASIAAKIVRQEQGFNTTQTRVMWSRIEVLLDHEKGVAEAAWYDRMILAYLKVKEVV